MNSADGKPIDTSTSTTQEPTLYGENCKPGILNLGGLLCKKPKKEGEASRIIPVVSTREGDKPVVSDVSESSTSEKPMASGAVAPATKAGGWFSRGGKRKSKAKKSKRKNRKQKKSRKSRK